MIARSSEFDHENVLELVASAQAELESAKRIEEAIEVHGRVDAMDMYLRKNKATVGANSVASELKVRCERRIGQLLLESEAPRGRPKKGNEPLPFSVQAIGKMKAHRWRLLASLPDEVFEEHVRFQLNSGKEVTTDSAVKLAKRQPTAQEPGAIQMTGSETVNDLVLLEGRKFGTIYADPPWQYGNQATRASTDGHYDTMTMAEIAAMPVGALAAEQSHIHLWTTNAFLFEARTVMEAWGFEYKSCYVWVKTQMGIGNYWRLSHEFLLLGIRGGLRVPESKRMRSWDEYPRTKHSRKPEAIRHKVEQISPGPYLELFGRQAIVGWTVYGNQVRQDKTLFKR